MSLALRRRLTLAFLWIKPSRLIWKIVDRELSYWMNFFNIVEVVDDIFKLLSGQANIFFDILVPQIFQLTTSSGVEKACRCHLWRRILCNDMIVLCDQITEELRVFSNFNQGSLRDVLLCNFHIAANDQPWSKKLLQKVIWSKSH